MHTAPGTCLLYAPGARCVFQIWSWSIFDLEYSSRLLMVQDHMVQEQMILDHMSRPKSQKKKACQPVFIIYITLASPKIAKSTSTVLHF